MKKKIILTFFLFAPVIVYSMEDGLTYSDKNSKKISHFFTHFVDSGYLWFRFWNVACSPEYSSHPFFSFLRKNPDYFSLTPHQLAQKHFTRVRKILFPFESKSDTRKASFLPPREKEIAIGCTAEAIELVLASAVEEIEDYLVPFFEDEPLTQG